MSESNLYEDASVKTFILLGARAEELGLLIGKNTASVWPVLKVVNLAPTHVNCVRLYIGPIPEAFDDDMIPALQQFADTYQVKVLHDDYLTYGKP